MTISRLKWITAIFMLLGVALLVGWPWILGPRPSADDSREERRAYARRLSWLLGGMTGALVASGVGSLLIVRRAKSEYRDATMRNLKSLAEIPERSRDDS